MAHQRDLDPDSDSDSDHDSAGSAPAYEVVVVGGGPAGLTTAIYATRLGHETAVFEKEGGRHAAVEHVHNLLGVSENVSGRELAAHAVAQLEHYGGDFFPDAVDAVTRLESGQGNEPRFRLEAGHATVDAERIVFATGFRDRGPDVPEIERFAGRGLHYCLHCDAYALGDGPVFVLGHAESAAHVAMTMCNFTAEVDLLLDGREPEWDEETDEQLRAHPVDRIETTVVSAYEDETERGGSDEPPRLGGLSFGDGTERDYLGGFAMYGSAYNADLAADLGCELTDDGAIAVDDRRETSVDGVYAVGDVTHGQNQTTIAIGDGAYAGLAVHKDLRRFPKSLEEIRAADGADENGGKAGEAENRDGSSRIEPSDPMVPAASPALRARMRRVRDLDVHPGLRGPSPGRE
ncbi:pyridine nucleotide-disulfide oxidoreductase [Halobiforma lacisalsi AJ5]|uniref:Pyridine nucleotide-disulfide oxidoreductase n=1 Tax=Natronobacterium lacisalsi AJ5 TaxID=358396 RepID=M0LUZ5_NATLA|nr:NAD(P)/FAD-dependent oxidoreductase [Halobiforma lacisalsi]APW97640.1 pyridine nucleotide-disulfide oxidoreductase [Halobiforma lacisalsi AJ5]EMA36973.1 FAD-dependent pyridine nucleotide-disulfide oxidoreductase [Halobiforma lacisalsi AJ5]